jgi:hypothetical protein
MKYRKLRIAWTVAWGIAAVLLVGLWMRSYWWADLINIQYQWPCAVARGNAFYRFNLEWNSAFKRRYEFRAFHTELEVEEIWLPTGNFNVIGPSVTAPLWLIATASVVTSVFAWIPWRFSLRTLLIATTLVAVGLGLVVWLR